MQFERLESANQLQKEHEVLTKVRAERDAALAQLHDLQARGRTLEQQREQERLQGRQSVRDTEKEKEEYRLKLVGS